MVHRPRLPIRKPVRGKRNKVVPFVTKRAMEQPSYVILATEKDLFHILIEWLVDKRHDFVKVEGGYKMQDGSNKFVIEEAVLVEREVAVKIWANGWLDTQESILHLYSGDVLGRYRAELVFLNDPTRKDVDLGLFVQTTREVALSNADGYTYKPETGTYYVVVPSGCASHE